MPVIHEKKQSKPSTVRKSHQRAIEEAYSTTFYHVQPHHSEEFSTDAQSIRDQFTVRTPADCPLNTAAAFLAPRKLAVGILKENSHTRKKPAGHINRPPNAFILFRSAQSANMTSATTSNNGQQQRMSSLIAAYWRSLSKAERATWFSLADDVKNFHNLLFPEYRFIPHPNTVEAEERTRKTNMHAHSTATPAEDAYIDQEMVKFILRHNGGVTVDLEALAVQERLLASESSTSKKPRSKRAPKQVKADAPSPIIQMPQVPDMFPSYPSAVSDYGSPSSSAFSPVLMSPVLEPYSAVGSPYPDFSGKQEDIGSPLIQFDPNYSMQQCYSPVTYTDSPVSAPSSTLVTPQSGITHTAHHQASIQFGDDVYNSYSLHTNSNVGPMDGFLNMAPGSSDWNGQQVEVSPGGVAFINSFAVAEPQPQVFSNPMYFQPEVQPQKANQALQLQHQYYMPAESQQEAPGSVHSPWVVEDGWFPPSSTSTAVHTPTAFA